MSLLTFRLLSNPEILKKLKAELELDLLDPGHLYSLVSPEQLP